MKNKPLTKHESGFVIVLFLLVLPVLLGLLGLVVDSASMYSASMKASAAAEAGVTAAVLARIKETDTTILEHISNTATEPNYEEDYLELRATTEATNNVLNNGILASAPVDKNNTVDNKNRAVQIAPDTRSYKGIESIFRKAPPGGSDTLQTNVRLLVPTLLMHFVKRDQAERKRATIVLGTATISLKGANYIFVLDLSSSQACPAGQFYAVYCVCKADNATKKKYNAVGQSCQQEADRVTDPDLKGLLRIEKTRDSLKSALSRLDTRRDRLSIIGFNSVAFTILPFDTDPSHFVNGKAGRGFNIEKVRARLDQLKSKDKAVKAFKVNDLVYGVPVIVPEGLTNLSDGFITAYQEAKAAGLTGKKDEKYNLVYYSDGGSTAMRANFLNLRTQTIDKQFTQRTKPRLEVHKPGYERLPRTFDFLYEIDAHATGRTNDKFSYPAMPWTNDLINYQVYSGGYDFASPMVSSALYKRWYLRNLVNRPDSTKFGTSIPLNFSRPVSQYPNQDARPKYDDPTTDIVENKKYYDDKYGDPYYAYSQNIMLDCFCLAVGSSKVKDCSLRSVEVNMNVQLDLAARKAVFNNCMTGFAATYKDRYDSNGNPTTIEAKDKFGTTIPIATMFPPPRGQKNPSPSTDFRYLYYMSAMEAADLITSDRGTINGIGYGISASIKNRDGTMDMAQGLDNVTGLKAGVMANLASAFDELLDLYKPTGAKSLEDIDAIYGKTGSIANGSYQTLKSRKDSGKPGGAFYNAPSALEFEQFLNLLIIKIRMSVQSVT